MKIKKDVYIDEMTKKAWDDNWKDVNIEQMLGIFKYPRVQKHLEIYKTYLPKDKKILEGGCGLGPYLIYLRRLGYDIVGIDYNQEPLYKIAGYDKSIPVCCADVLNIPFPNSFFGAYLSLGVIEHFTQGPQAAIKEAYRVLVPGGYFIVQVPRSSIFRKIKYPLILLKKNKILRRIFNKKLKHYYWEQYFKVSELSAIMKKNSFEVINVIPVDHEHALSTFCSLFRDKKLYDGANRLAILISYICQKYAPWLTAAGMVFICKKN